MPEKQFKLKISDGEGISAYLYLPDHPGSGTVGVAVTQVSLKELYPNYKGAAVYFDFDREGVLIGIGVTSD